MHIRSQVTRPQMPEKTTIEQRIDSAAKRALAEAVERRKTKAMEEAGPKELGGRKGPDPARYGDWEKKGIAVDF